MSKPQKQPKCCTRCQCDEFVVNIRDDVNHYAEWQCLNCQMHNGWVADPNKEKTKRSASHKNLVKKYGQGFCQMCLLDSNNLEGHHVIPYKNDGDSTKDNVWILCRSCHTLIHHERTYHGTNDRITN